MSGTFAGVLDPSPFESSGLASLDDLESETWKQTFVELEDLQRTFLATEPHFPEYKGARDMLHNFIRVWEYPYVYNNIKRALQLKCPHEMPRVLDVGSGVTFFPFAIARLGCNVIALDVDQCSSTSFSKA